MIVSYQRESDLSVAEFIHVLEASTLSQRRPVQDRKRIQTMLENADIVVTARINDEIVGVSRAITDYSYCCYLSDLAVDERYQRQGIGKKLIDETHALAGKSTTLILLASPMAQSYYPSTGMTHADNAWIIQRAS